MEFSQKQIFEICISRKIYPSQTNFAQFSEEVQEIILRKSGFERGSVSDDSLKNLSKESLNFTKRANRVWEKYKDKRRLFQHEAEPGKFLDQVFTVSIKAASPPIPRRQTPSAPKPSTSSSSTGPMKRSARKAFEDKSSSLQRRESAKIRAQYPPGAIRMAASQTFREDGDWDSAACLKEFVVIPGSSKKARTSLGIDNPGKNLKVKKPVELSRYNNKNMYECTT